MAKEVTPHLAQAIARAITHSARTVLVQHGMPEAAKLASELGNNSAQNVVFLIERFLLDDDPAATLEAEIEALQD